LVFFVEGMMPRPYSVDLRERALLACEDGVCFAEVARRFRIGVSTLRLWRGQARAGQRAPRRMGRGPTPLGGQLSVLAAIASEHREATLAEYAVLLAARTGTPPRSRPAICRALKHLGWVRKQKRSGPASRTVRTCAPPGRSGGPRRGRSIRAG
jgi:transposase